MNLQARQNSAMLSEYCVRGGERDGSCVSYYRNLLLQKTDTHPTHSTIERNSQIGNPLASFILLSYLSLSLSPCHLLFNFAVQLICMRFAIIEIAKGLRGVKGKEARKTSPCRPSSCSCSCVARTSKVLCHHDSREICVNSE